MRNLMYKLELQIFLDGHNKILESDDVKGVYNYGGFDILPFVKDNKRYIGLGLGRTTNQQLIDEIAKNVAQYFNIDKYEIRKSTPKESCYFLDLFKRKIKENNSENVPLFIVDYLLSEVTD